MTKTHLPINNLEDTHVSERTVNKIFLICSNYYDDVSNNYNHILIMH